MNQDQGDVAFDGHPYELWSLREDVDVELELSAGEMRLSSRWGDVSIRQPSPRLREALHRMRLGPIALENVVNGRDRTSADVMAQEHQDESANGGQSIQLAELYRVLDQLQPLIIRTLGFESGRPLLSVVPLSPQSRFRPVPLSPDARIRLSTFAELRTDGKEYYLESPLALHRVLLHGAEAVALTGSMGRPVSVAECAEASPGSAAVSFAALAYLAAAGMVVQAEEPPDGQDDLPPVFAEDVDPGLAGWSQTDLMFHTRRTSGRHDNPIGITYPLGRAGSPEPVVKPQRLESIPLHRPRWDDLSATDPALAVAMEGRRSMRVYDAAPVTAEELGTLLYRTARVRSVITPASAHPGPPPPEPGQPGPGQPDPGQPSQDQPDPRLSDRPYPGGGACYELELYLTVGNCSGIQPGIYHYDPLGHRLEPVNSDRAMVDELLISAGAAAAMQAPPSVLITMTARFQRLSWKYEGIAYAVMLMNVGVLIQSLYLVCTAMQLAPCAIGSVRADATARAFGTDWRSEPSVGQFIVGRAPVTPPRYSGEWHAANDADWAGLAHAALDLAGKRV